MQGLSRSLSRSFGDLGSLYSRNLSARPLRTNSVSAFIIFVFGNVLSQTINKIRDPKYKFELIDMVIMGVYGIIGAALGTKWFDLLEHKLSPMIANVLGLSGRTSMGLLKVSLDQFIWSPIVSVLFLSYQALVNKADPVKAIKKDFVKLYSTALMFWFPVLLLNFMFVPHKYRIIVANLAGLVWGFLLSYLFV